MTTQDVLDAKNAFVKAAADLDRARRQLERAARDEAKRNRRRNRRTQVEREDEVLERWEAARKSNPRPRQRDVAAEMGLKYSTFRTYLAHARARRDRP